MSMDHLDEGDSQSQSTSNQDEEVIEGSSLKEEEDDEISDVMMPLVELAPRIRKRRDRRSLDISNRDDEEEEESCWGDSWKMVASILLTALLLAPMIHSHFRRYNNSVNPSSNDQTNNQGISSANNCLLDFTQLMTSMREEGHNYCRENATQCRCYSSLNPEPGLGRWVNAHQRNINLVANYKGKLDVAFIGDSITEHWVGTDMGDPNSKNDPIKQVFETTFQGSTAKYHGIALGISGDVCPELLYRLQNGELPDSPSVIWVLIGANDLGHACAIETVVAGVISIVEYLVRARPNATIVVNSLLPALRFSQTVQNTALIPFSEGINDRLACYVDSQPSRVQFFNATGLFVKGNHVVGMREFVHPSGEGSRVWADAIVEKLDQILQ